MPPPLSRPGILRRSTATGDYDPIILAISDPAASSAYEDKLNQAANYQGGIAGPTVPLTAEVLKRQRREVASNRSTSDS